MYDVFVYAIGLASGIGMTCATIPQAWKIYKTKSASDLSYATVAILYFGTLGWFIYGALRGDPVIVLCNGIALLPTGSTLVLKIKYGSASPSPPIPAKIVGSD